MPSKENADGSYLQKVSYVFQGETFGELYWGEMAARCGDAEQAYKCRVLQQLERETKERAKRLLLALGGSIEENDSGSARARETAVKLADKLLRMPWIENIRRLSTEISKFTGFFEQLETYARNTQERDLLEALTGHERALKQFVDHELSGSGNRSVEPILIFLEDPPQRGSFIVSAKL